MNKNSVFYLKKGNLNYRERTMLEALKKATTDNPELLSEITPANDFNELKNLHDKLTIQDVEPVMIEPNMKEESTPESNPFIDPLNREEPNVRDYVMDDKFDPFADFQKSNKSAFGEPQTYDQAFEYPTDEELRQTNQSNQQSKTNRPNPTTNNNQQQNGVDPAKERRKSKRFAKTIVELVCGLLEVGFVWYATKDTNPNKLMEYEINDEMDLGTLIDLPNGVEATIKDYFMNQIGEITEASKISDEEREQLTDDLTEVFIENNIQPNASINLAISGLTIVSKQGIKLYQIVSTNNQLLNQLRERKINGVNPQPSYSQPTEYPKQETYQEPKKSKAPIRKKKSNDLTDEDLEQMDRTINELSLLSSVPTIE